jgi:hypothetical protein
MGSWGKQREMAADSSPGDRRLYFLKVVRKSIAAYVHGRFNDSAFSTLFDDYCLAKQPQRDVTRRCNEQHSHERRRSRGYLCV